MSKIATTAAPMTAEQTAANEALIAAAPDLLHAARLALSALVGIKSYDWLRENIQAAIKKAEGAC